MMKNLKVKKKPPLPPPLSRPNEPRRCFRCDGTGRICDCCGESDAACSCEREGLGLPARSDCDDCKGTGR